MKLIQHTQTASHSHSIWRITVVVVAALSLWGSLPGQAHGKGPKPNTIVVRLDPSSGASIAGINATYGTTTLQTVTGIPNTFVVQPVNPKQDAHGMADKIGHDRRVLFAEEELLTNSTDGNPSRTGSWGQPTPPEYVRQDSTAPLNLPQAQAMTRGAGTIVAVLDTGAQLNHHELTGSLVPGYDFIDNDSTPEDVPGGAESGHGTHIAGIIHLVAPDAKIMPVRVLDADGHGSLISLTEGIYFAIQNHATVINISLGTLDQSAFLNSIMDEARQRGIIIVSSAGNDGREERQYPAADQCVVSVTSVDHVDGHSSFSNYGDWITVAAPGESVYSTFLNDGFAYWSGTSMSSPFVAGQVALIRSVAPQYTLRDIITVMQDTSVDISKLTSNRGHGVDNKLGAGRIDIGASVQRAATGYIGKDKPKHFKDECFR